MQDVPITMQAFGSETLEATGINSTDFLSEIVPNLQATRQLAASTPYLRGVGTQNGATGDESSISLFVDGVYSASALGNDQAFANVERVEVLKGPQGTLFGRNATGGVIHIVTKDPSQEATGEFGLSYGDYDTVKTNLYATGGLSDTVAADISVHYEDQGEGYGRNITTGNEIGVTERTSIRTKWLFTPNDETRITLIGGYNSREGSLGGARAPIPGALGADGGLIFQGCLLGGGDQATCTAAAQTGATMAQSNTQSVAADGDTFIDTEQLYLSAKVEYSLDSFDLVSITGYQDTKVNDFLDQDATPFPVVNATLPRQEDMFSQEFQLLSTGDGPLSWIAGLYYLQFDAAYDGFALTGLGLQALDPTLAGLTLDVSQDLTSYAAFGQINYDLSDRTRLTAGLRYTKDERDVSGVTEFQFGPVASPVPFSGNESWSEPTWRLALDYQATEDVLLFGSYSRGFKSGVFNSVVTSGVLAPPVNPEVLDAYELGFKSDLMDGRVRFNGTVFYYEYTDLQLIAISAGVTRLSNAASAEVKGAEFDLAAAVTDNLELRAAFGLLDSEYENFDCTVSVPTGIGGNTLTPTPEGCNGNTLIRAPELSGNIGLTHTADVGSGILTSNLNWYYNDGFFWEPDNRIKEDSYDLLNAEVSWMNANESYRVRVFGNNLTDTEYSIFTTTGELGDLQSMAPPRTWGIGFDLYW